MSDDLASAILPKTSATITVRIIKSFEYRTEKSLVLHDTDLERMTVGGLKLRVLQTIHTDPGWKPFHTVMFGSPDTMKIYTKAHGAKTSSLIINLDHEELMLENDDACLSDLGIENETELSFFNQAAYAIFKSNPKSKWM